MNPEQIADILDDAADHIEKYGHQKGDGYGPGDYRTAPSCCIGAINVVLEVCDDRRFDIHAALHAVLPVGAEIAAWNDAPERTQQEVLDAFRLAAKEQRMRAVADVLG